jgi:hypothetical protein
MEQIANWKAGCGKSARPVWWEGRGVASSLLPQSGHATVEIAGLDIYDPIKDEVKSRDIHDIAY